MSDHYMRYAHEALTKGMMHFKGFVDSEREKAGKAWDAYTYAARRPTQLALGLTSPREGLTRGQNTYLDLFGFDDRAVLGPNTNFGRNYWYNEVTNVKPSVDKFKEENPWISTAATALSPASRLILDDDVRNQAATYGAQFAHDPLVLGGVGRRLYQSLRHAGRYNRFNTGAVTNFPLHGRLYRSLDIQRFGTRVTQENALSRLYGTVNATTTGNIVFNPYLSTPNHYLTEMLNDEVYGQYRPYGFNAADRSMIPGNISDQAVSIMKRGLVADNPHRMDMESYINYLMTPINEKDVGEMQELLYEYFGKLGEYAGRPPILSSTLTKPDQREDGLSSTSVPVRSVGGVRRGETGGVTMSAAASDITKRHKYENAVMRHARHTPHQEDINRVWTAAVWKYYNEAYPTEMFSEVYDTYRRSHIQNNAAVWEDYKTAAAENPVKMQLIEEFTSDESRAAERIRLGQIPTVTDLTDIESLVYWNEDPDPGKSEVLRRIGQGEYEELPWILKPARYRRYGTVKDKDVSLETGSFEEHFSRWHLNENMAYPNLQGETDLGKMFSEHFKGAHGLPTDMAGAEAFFGGPEVGGVDRSKFRDMFYNPMNGNVYELANYLIRSDKDFLRRREEQRSHNAQRKTFQTRFVDHYPLIRLPGDIVVGPTTNFDSEKGQYISGLNERSHIEIVRVADTLFSDSPNKNYGKIINNQLYRDLITDMYDPEDQPMYNPYQNIVMPRRTVETAAASLLQPFMSAATDDSQRTIIQGAADYLTELYTGYMVGTPDHKNKGTETLFKRLTDKNFSVDRSASSARLPREHPDHNPYALPNSYFAAEEQVLDSLRALPGMEDVDVTDMETALKVTLHGGYEGPDYRIVKEDYMQYLHSSMSEDYRGQLYNDDTMTMFVNAGAVVNYVSPVIKEEVVNSWGFHIPAMTPGSSEMIAKSIRDVNRVYVKRTESDMFSEEAMADTSPARIFDSRMQVADLSISNMINNARNNVNVLNVSMTDAALEGMSSWVDDEGAKKFFGDLRFDTTSLNDRLRSLVKDSQDQAKIQLYDSAGAATTAAGEIVDSFMWPNESFITTMELPEGEVQWNSANIYRAYTDEVRSLFLRNPEVMHLNLASTMRQFIDAFKAPSSEDTIDQVEKGLEKLMFDIMPNYEICVGQDPLARSRAMHLIKEIGEGDPDRVLLRSDELVADLKSLVMHMQGTFGNNQEGLMWATALRAIPVSPESQSRIMSFVHGYTSEALSLSETINSEMQESIQHLVARTRSGLSVGSGWKYGIEKEDIDALSKLSARIDKPIRMDPTSLSMTSELNLALRHTHDLLTEITARPEATITKEQVAYLESAAMEIDHLQDRLQRHANHHYFDSLYNLAYNPDVTAENIDTYFQVQPTVLNTVSENPAALAIVSSHLGENPNPIKAMEAAETAAALRIITSHEAEGIRVMAEIRDKSTRMDLSQVLFDIYAAHRPTLPEHVTNTILRNRGSKYGIDMQEVVGRIRNDPDFAQYFVSAIMTDFSDVGIYGTVEFLARHLDIPTLPFMQVYFLDYPKAAANAIQLISRIMVDELQKNP